MNENLFAWLTPITYWLLAILWAMILMVYVRVIRDWQHISTAMKVLLWVLVIDAIRTLFESLYFGGWYTAKMGILPEYIYEFLVQPQNVFVPKLTNVIAGFIILTLLLRRWLPDLMRELKTQSIEIEREKSAEKIAHMGNWEWDIINGNLQWSDEVYRIFGLPSEQYEAGYELFLQSVHPDDRSRVEEALRRAQKDPDYHFSIEHRVLHSDGSQLIVQENARVFRDERGEPHHMIGTVLDITERKRVEEALVQAKEEAEVANMVKSRFLSSMSHELRTPLNAILGFSDMMTRDKETTAKQQKMLETISHSGDHLLRMINDVLDFSKVEAGRGDLEPDAFDLQQMLQDIAEMIRARTEKRNIQLLIDLDQDLAPYVKADISKLRQILINLLDNAIKFTTEGGVSLRARTRPMKGDPAMVTLQLEVEDSGPGIPKEDLDQIFLPFFQSDSHRNGSTGTGLGLTVTRSFVELMGGEICVESTPGKGSLFRVDLPVALAEKTDMVGADEAGAEVIGLETDQPQWRILVVEDDEANRLLLSSLLEQAGFEIREAKNGAEAITQFEEWQPHFIWMDMRMPVLDGYQAIARIRELPGGDKVKIAAITASVFKEQRTHILEAGCDALVHKPFKSHEIFGVLAEILGVRYLYATESEEEAGQGAEAILTAEMLEALPEALRQALRKTVYSLDISGTKKVIESIRNEQPDAADGLLELTEKYLFCEILALLDNTE